MTKRIIKTSNAPQPVGPYSQANQHGNLVFVAGQVALDPKTGKLFSGGIEEQTTRVLDNIKAILSEAGTSLDNVLKVSVFLRDVKDFGRMNEIYKKYFPANQPARTTVGAQFPMDGILVEIDAIASGP